MNPVELVEHLFEAVHERERAHNANGLLSPHLLESVYVCSFQFPLQAAAWLFIEIETRAIGPLAHIVRQDETERLRSLIVTMQCNSAWEAE